MSKTLHTRTPNGTIHWAPSVNGLRLVVSKSVQNFWDREQERQDRKAAAARRVRGIARREALTDQIIGWVDEGAPANDGPRFPDGDYYPMECSDGFIEDPTPAQMARIEEEAWAWLAEQESYVEAEGVPGVEILHTTTTGERPPVLGPYESDEWEGPDPRFLDDDDDDLWGDSDFLPLVDIHGAYEVFGGDGFLIEGPSVTPVEPKATHYYRVHELAKEIGVESRDLVKFLRSTGEYVRGHMSWVADPVAERHFARKDALVCAFGPRKVKPVAGYWFEDRLSDCDYGCKVYRHWPTGQTRLEHNRTYGCPQGR